MGEIIAEPKLVASLVAAVLIIGSLVFFFARGFKQAMDEEKAKKAEAAAKRVWSSMPRNVPTVVYVRDNNGIDVPIEQYVDDCLMKGRKRSPLDDEQTIRKFDRADLARAQLDHGLITFDEAVRFIESGNYKKGPEKWRV